MQVAALLLKDGRCDRTAVDANDDDSAIKLAVRRSHERMID